MFTDLAGRHEVLFLCNRKLRSYYIKYAPLRMRTAAYNVGVASDRRRRENVPRQILCSIIGNFVPVMFIVEAFASRRIRPLKP